MNRRKKVLRRALFTLLGIFILLNVMAVFHAWKFTHFKPGAVRRTGDERSLSFTEKLSAVFFGVSLPRPENGARLPPLPFSTVMLQSAGAKLECWQLPADSARGTVVLCHGYGGAKASMLEKAAIFRALHYNVFLPDFRGAGGSEGNTCTIGWDESKDVMACVCYVKKSGERHIVLAGTSMGAAAIMKALHDDTAAGVSAVILECPYGSMLRTVQNRFRTVGLPPVPLANMLVFWGGVANGFNAFRLRPDDYAAAIHCPALLVWGERDPKVSAGETDTIYARLAGPKRLLSLPDAGHNDYFIHYRQRWTGAVATLLRSSEKPLQ